jgi:phage/plasmid primase-like uncharacterized protein
MTRIFVTQADIDAGVRLDEHHCPIARALRREFPASQLIVVEDDSLAVEYADIKMYGNLSAYAKKFVANFDDGMQVFPFYEDIEFEVHKIILDKPAGV